MEKNYAVSKSGRLTRVFALSSLIIIAVASVTSSLLISRFVTKKMIERDTETTTSFVQSLAVVQQARSYFLGHQAPDENLNEFIRHVSAMPDVVRANIYARDRTVLWSSNADLIGKRFKVNPELDEIFMEKGKSHSGVIGEDVLSKAEHHELDRNKKIIETYVAVLDPQTRLVMGAIEFYKNPQPLWESINTLNQCIWLVAISVGLLLYISLILFVRQLGRHFSQMDPDLRITKIMAQAVSRGMQQSAAAHADSLASWSESLDRYAEAGPPNLVAASLNEIVSNCLNGFGKHLETAGIQFATDLPSNLPDISTDPVWLRIALDNVIQHAIKSLPEGGRLTVSARADEAHKMVYLEMRDGGKGPKSGPQPCEDSADDLELARNLIERMGGKLILAPLIDGACDRTLRLRIA